MAATKYLEENQHKASIVDDAFLIKKLDIYIGHLNLESIHITALQEYIKARKQEGGKVKNRDDRLIILNQLAKAVIEKMRGKHKEYVFTYHDRRIGKINNSAWKKARLRTGLPVRVHDLKHTFGQRLRSAGVSFEDRQDLLGHRSGRITTHYSAAELHNLIGAANKACHTTTSPAMPFFSRAHQ